MSHGYQAVTWSRAKLIYDALALTLLLSTMGAYVAVTTLTAPAGRAPADEVLAIRALGAGAIVLLHVTLAIGPAARLWPALLPALFNRRHLGVLTFLVALAHGALSTVYYHGFGVVDPLTSLLSTAGQTVSLATLPYQLFGAGALVVLLVLAATSHDFWLAALGARAWKALHMMVYVAYALLLAHVALGALTAERATPALLALGAGATALIVLHLASALHPRTRTRAAGTPDALGWIDAGEVSSIPDRCARVVTAPSGARIAVFRDDQRVTAIDNVCAHQGGPLGEGRIIDGCVTCPWHGHQFDPASGRAPAPFTDRVRTYPVRISAGRVLVQAQAISQRADHPQEATDAQR